MKRQLFIVSILTLASPLALAQGLPDAAPPMDPAMPAEPATPAEPADPAVPAQKDPKKGAPSQEVDKPRASGSARSGRNSVGATTNSASGQSKARARSSNEVGDFAAFDANGDGKLNREEARADGSLDFTAMDRDKDGSVSRGEYESATGASAREEKPGKRRR